MCPRRQSIEFRPTRPDFNGSKTKQPYSGETIRQCRGIMGKSRPNFLLLVLVLATALPASAALMLYKFTGDPTLRPFGLTKNSLAEGDNAQAVLEILVQLDWGVDVPATVLRDDVRQRLGNALDIYDIDFRLKFSSVPGPEINVTYVVEHNQFGPYRFHNASQGIPSALAAFRAMKQPQKN
jgi:hypothetical protein